MKKTAFFLCVLLTASCRAEVITVDDDGPADFNSIQAAINRTDQTDVIVVQPGLYQEQINFLGKNIIVTSVNPSNEQIVRDTIIAGSSHPYYRSVVFRGTENQSCILTGFNVRQTVIGYDHDVDPTGSNHTQATISHCLLEAVESPCGGVISCFDGAISNCVIADPVALAWCQVPDYAIYRCHGLIKNCTVRASVLVGTAASATIQSCIFYSDSQLAKPVKLLGGATLNVSYCNFYESTDPIEVQDSNCVVNWGPGNMNVDPCFVRLGVLDTNEPVTYYAGDYHLKSQGGLWDANSSQWVIDTTTSLCIDAGNPGCPPDSEPSPNGNRINMGAFGGSATASKSPADFRSLSDLDNDWNTDFNDLGIFADYWLDSGRCLPSDLDRNQSVDFEDYAIFAYDPCSGSAAAGPEIIYQVGDCGREGPLMLLANGDGNDLRFSVSVQGQYILFEDMMRANCCPDELVMQMTVENDLITIQEIEYLTNPCHCICDYPLTATLGPFQIGTYTLEVYQDQYYGGFIGSTTVIIEAAW